LRMVYKGVICTLSPGMFSDEWCAGVPCASGGEAYFFVPKDAVRPLEGNRGLLEVVCSRDMGDNSSLVGIRSDGNYHSHYVPRDRLVVVE